MNCDYVLITNIERVQRKNDPMHLTCYAVLLEDVKHGVLKGPGMRGFFADPAAPVFTYLFGEKIPWPHHIDFIPPKIDPGRPCFNHYELEFANGPTFDFYTLDSDRPIDVQSYNGDIYQVWADLREKVAKYWTRPAMPVVEYAPPPLVLMLPNLYRTRLEQEKQQR